MTKTEQIHQFDMTIGEAQRLAIFVWIGFYSRERWAPGDSDFYNGQTGAADHVTKATRQLRLAYRRFLAKNPQGDYPGVFEYEVCQPFGAWLRLNPYSDEKAQYVVAMGLIRKFFVETIDTITPTLRKMHADIKKIKKNNTPS